MLLSFWLNQPVWLIFTLNAIIFIAPIGFICLLTNWRRTQPTVRSYAVGTVGPYFSSFSVLLALFIGFVANDAWERQRHAARAVQTERANLMATYDLSIATVADTSAIRKAIVAYADALIDDEWLKMSEGGSSVQAGEALGVLMRAAANPQIGVIDGPTTHAALLDAAVNLRAARGDRLALCNAENDQSKWLTLMVLACLTLTAIGLVHVENTLAQVVKLSSFQSRY